MFFRNIKAQSEVVKTILILFISLAFVFSNIYFYISFQDISFQDSKVKIQTIHNNLLENCFNNFFEFGIVEENLFNRKSLDRCLNLDDVYLYLKLDGVNKEIFYPSKKDFNERIKVCKFEKTSSNCVSQNFPIILIDFNNERRLEKLNTFIIS